MQRVVGPEIGEPGNATQQIKVARVYALLASQPHAKPVDVLKWSRKAVVVLYHIEKTHPQRLSWDDVQTELRGQIWAPVRTLPEFDGLGISGKSEES